MLEMLAGHEGLSRQVTSMYWLINRKRSAACALSLPQNRYSNAISLQLTETVPRRPHRNFMRMPYSSYRKYLLVFLIILYAFNFADSVALGMALQSIKVDLHLSDTDLGLLSGIAFMLFYASFGIPMGRWADQGNRVTILFVTRLLWSAFVILTGRARSFLQLLILRAGAAVGESGCLPPAYSLISDYFSREQRPKALGFFYLGSASAAVISFVGSGWLMQLYGWRGMFTIIGLPGILLALLTRLTLFEPRRERNASPTDGKEDVPALSGSRRAPSSSFWQELQQLYANTTYRNLLLAFVASYFFSGSNQWQAAYFLREYALKSSTLGTWLSVVYGIPGMAGCAFGGLIASHWANGNERLQLLAVAVLYCCAGLFLTTAYLATDYHVAFAMMGLSTLCTALQLGPVFATLQTVVPPRLRAVSLTITFFFANLIGNGLGPLFVGSTSDFLRRMAGVESLRYALALLGPWFCLSSWFAWRASKAVALDIEAAKDHQ